MKRVFQVVFCAFLIFLVKCDQLEEVTVHLELLEMDLADHCTNLSLASRDIFLRKHNAYKHKFEVQKKFSDFSKKESEEMRTLYHINGLNLPDDYKHRWNILEKMGDNELSAEDWTKLTKFGLETEKIANELQIPCEKIPCDKLPCVVNKTVDCRYSKTEVSEMLRKSRDANYLRAVWSAAQEDFLSKGKYYSDILNLVKSAAKANGFVSPETYWSNMVEYQEVYLKARSLWSEIEPFYKKLHDFVRSRLEQIYHLPNADIVPIYILGSENGLDWTNVADKILPHRYLYDEINASLHHEKIGGKQAYELAEKLTTNLGLKKIGAKFWVRSIFNMTCPSKLLLYCSDKYSQVLTCNKTGYSEYLDAHEDMTRATINQIDYSTAIYHEFRFSVIDEAITQLSTILAMKTLPMNGLIPEEVILAEEETQHNQMTALLLTALRVFPKLSYYFLADEFRLHELNEPSKDIVGKWWEHRQKYQFISGVTNQEWGFLADEYIIKNKPYIGKFLGTFLQFQILDHYVNNGEDHINILSRMSKDKSFKSLIKNRQNQNWLELLQEQYGIYDIESDAILEYFRPLEHYMDNAPSKQVTQTLMPRTTTAKPTTTLKTTVMPTENPKIEPKVDSEIPIVGNIQKSPTVEKEVKKIELTKTNEPVNIADNEVTTGESNHGFLIGALIGVLCLLVIGGVVAKKKCRRRPGTNNRRFET